MLAAGDEETPVGESGGEEGPIGIGAEVVEEGTTEIGGIELVDEPSDGTFVKESQPGMGKLLVLAMRAGAEVEVVVGARVRCRMWMWKKSEA